MAGVMEIGIGLVVRISDPAASGGDGPRPLVHPKRGEIAATGSRVHGTWGYVGEGGDWSGQWRDERWASMPGLQGRETKLATNDRRKTKIVCTIGPSTNTREMIWKLAEARMNVARLNLSHGTYYAYATQNQEKGPEVQSGVVVQRILLKEGRCSISQSRGSQLG